MLKVDMYKRTEQCGVHEILMKDRTGACTLGLVMLAGRRAALPPSVGTALIVMPHCLILLSYPSPPPVKPSFSLYPHSFSQDNKYRCNAIT